jgi:hypothetical protein
VLWSRGLFWRNFGLWESSAADCFFHGQPEQRNSALGTQVHGIDQRNIAIRNQEWLDFYVTDKRFYDWQTAGGTDDVMRFVACLERADIPWCAIGGVAVNHWAEEPMVTRDVDFVVAVEAIDKTVELLQNEGFKPTRFECSINFQGSSRVSIQLSTEELYHSFPSKSVAADVHGILLRVASLEDTLTGKIAAWRDSRRRQSKRVKDFGDIVRLIEAHPHLWSGLPEDLKEQIENPEQPSGDD